MAEREKRRVQPARVYRLGSEPRDDLTAVTTPEQRLEMVALLSRRMWELQGEPDPAYDRANLPIRVVRRA